jgi:hypothetical protein
MAARHIRYDRAWRKGFRYDPSLDLVAPAPAPHRALWLRSVDYIPNHRCEPLCARRTTCGRPARRLQRGARRPLTQYRVDRLIERYGIDAKLFEWSDEITADCPRKQARNLNDQCGARCPDLSKVV